METDEVECSFVLRLACALTTKEVYEGSVDF